jgi:hypothetical protein
MIRKGILKGFDLQGYKAVVQMEGSQKAYLEAIHTAWNIPASAMIPGRNVAVACFSGDNMYDAVVVAVFSA